MFHVKHSILRIVSVLVGICNELPALSSARLVLLLFYFLPHFFGFYRSLPGFLSLISLVLVAFIAFFVFTPHVWSKWGYTLLIVLFHMKRHSIPFRRKVG